MGARGLNAKRPIIQRRLGTSQRQLDIWQKRGGATARGESWGRLNRDWSREVLAFFFVPFQVSDCPQAVTGPLSFTLRSCLGFPCKIGHRCSLGLGSLLESRARAAKCAASEVVRSVFRSPAQERVAVGGVALTVDG